MKRVILGLGSNLGDREANLAEAIRRLNDASIHVTRSSPIYETEPEGLTDQPWFLNSVVETETTMGPRAVLGCVKNIELAMKRKKTVRNAPRVIDIDILFYQSAIIRAPDLEIPHPRFRERRFVLAPLADISPDFRDPVTRRTIADLLANSTHGKFRRL